MNKLFLLLLSFIFSIAASAQFKKLVWADEFNYSGLPDSTKWGYDTGGGGWGNNELQFYTSRRINNAEVNNGLLTIKVMKDNYQGAAYTSARLVSKNRGDWNMAAWK